MSVARYTPEEIEAFRSLGRPVIYRDGYFFYSAKRVYASDVVKSAILDWTLFGVVFVAGILVGMAI